MADPFLVRVSSDYIHTSECRHADSRVRRWVWADRNPTVDWAADFPYLRPCKRCNPPSPFAPSDREAHG